MIVISGRVVDGKIVVEGADLPEGEIVTILARDADTPFELTPEQADFIAQSAEQMLRDQSVSGENVLQRIAPR